MRSKYTKEHQKLLGCKTEPQPWLHIVTMSEGGSDGKNYDSITSYAIYVWDTRQVIEERQTQKILRGTKDSMYLALRDIQITCKDSLSPLKGSKHFNMVFQLK
jgi:hypothetical protein